MSEWEREKRLSFYEFEGGISCVVKSFLCSRNHTFFSCVLPNIKIPAPTAKRCIWEIFPTPKVSKFVLDEVFIYFWFFRSFRFAQDYKGARDSRSGRRNAFRKSLSKPPRDEIRENDLFWQVLIAQRTSEWEIEGKSSSRDGPWRTSECRMNLLIFIRTDSVSLA